MRKLSKLLLIILFMLLISFNFTFVFATEGENLETEIVEDTSEEPEVIEENASDIKPLSTLTPSTSTTVSTINSYEEANLSLNNILCIILIAIGVLIILLSIAILIRIKK